MTNFATRRNLRASAGLVDVWADMRDRPRRFVAFVAGNRRPPPTTRQRNGERTNKERLQTINREGLRGSTFAQLTNCSRYRLLCRSERNLSAREPSYALSSTSM